MMDAGTLVEIHSRLSEIRRLSKEIAAVPNMPADIWTMRGIDEKAKQIHDHASWISGRLGSGGGGGTGHGGTGHGGTGHG